MEGPTAPAVPRDKFSDEIWRSKMKVLVTGGSGFIGSHVVDKLKQYGIEVRIFDMVMSSYRKDVEFYKGSLLNFDELSFAMCDIDAVFHLSPK